MSTKNGFNLSHFGRSLVVLSELMEKIQERKLRDNTVLMLVALGVFFYAVLFILWNFSPEQPLTTIPGTDSTFETKHPGDATPADKYVTQAAI